MANKWFKFYGAEYIGDPKMMSLTSAERSCWITLLCYASLTEGIIEFLTEENLMIHSGISTQEDEWDKTRGVLDKFVKLRMIEITNDIIHIKNWKRRQESYLTGYERVKKYRAKKRNDNAMITSEQNRIDKNRIEEKRLSSSNKKEKRFYKGQEMRFAQNKWWVLPKDGGEWSEFDMRAFKETTIK